MARIQNEKHASEELNFIVQTADGEIRNPTVKDEIWTVIKEIQNSCRRGIHRFIFGGILFENKQNG